MVIQFISAIGMLLFGVNIISTSFEKLCGNKLRSLINTFSSNRTKGCLFGAILTVLFQSSTASVALIVGLSSTGILTLFQSVALIIGSNIGSALTTILVAFQSINIVQFFGLLTFIGVFMRIIFKSNTIKNWGMCIIGLGLTFISLSLMSGATESFKTSSEFLNIFTTISNPIVLVLIGLAFTGIVNSSLGTMAIIASLIGTTAGGILTIQSAVYLIYGMNIGTCLTGLLIGTTATSRDSLRTSISHLVFNIVGAILFTCLSMFDWVTPLTGYLNNPALQLVVVNIIFNIVTAIIMLLLLKPFCKFLKLIIPDKKVKPEPQNTPINEDIAILAFIQLSYNAGTMFAQTTQVLNSCVDFVSTTEDTGNLTELRQSCTDLIKGSEQMNASLFKLNGELSSETDLHSKKVLNDIFIGIKKTSKNIDKLLKSCMDGDNKVKFNQKQLKMITSLNELVKENARDMLDIFQQSQNKTLTKDVDKQLETIMERLEQILEIKVSAKKFVIQSTIAYGVKQYSSFLNVINYFEEINTNLIDITLSVIGEVPQSDMPEQITIDKLEEKC